MLQTSARACCPVVPIVQGLWRRHYANSVVVHRVSCCRRPLSPTRLLNVRRRFFSPCWCASAAQRCNSSVTTAPFNSLRPLSDSHSSASLAIESDCGRRSMYVFVASSVTSVCAWSSSSCRLFTEPDVSHDSAAAEHEPVAAVRRVPRLPGQALRQLHLLPGQPAVRRPGRQEAVVHRAALSTRTRKSTATRRAHLQGQGRLQSVR